MAKRALSPLAVWAAGALPTLLLLCARAACPELCECPRAHHVLCANRGLRAVPETSRSVRVLGLAGNFIGNVSARALARYGHLMRLDLQFNQIWRVHPGAFEELVELQELYLGHNEISTLQPGTFSALQKLAVLYSNDNSIQELSAEIFGKLDSLVRLRLDRNAIELLSESLFKHFSSLKFLHLESNQIHHIHHKTFFGLTKLQFLNLSDNKQTQLLHTSLFSQLRSLLTLLLSENHITHISAHVFQNLKKLTKLSLSNNRIVRLENGTLKGLSRLRELTMKGNLLTEILVGVLKPLVRIERLDLSDNRITRIHPAAFTRLTRLRELDLSNNQLTRISGGAFTSNAALLQLDLSGNEWRCDCRMEKLKEWMVETRARGKLLTAHVQCHHPPTLQGKYLDHVNDTELLEELTGSWSCRAENEAEMMEAYTAGRQEPPGVEERLKRGGEKEEDMETQDVQGGHKKKKMNLRPRTAPRTSAKASSSSALLEKGMFQNVMEENTSTWELSDVLENPGSQNDADTMAQKPGVEVMDACQFNHRYIANVSVNNVTSDSATVFWSMSEDTLSGGLAFRILFDRFGHSVRFQRYVYARGSARVVVLQELRPHTTYITCVEGVVGGALCQVAPRDHCAGFITTSPAAESDIRLQHVTAAVLAANALLILLVGVVWLRRVLRRRIRNRKSSTHTHVRHMYSTRRPYRAAMATTCVSSEFSRYQSGRVLAEDGDLIQFPPERFFDPRRDDDSVIP